MSWSDTFYPGNSEKRNILTDCGELKALLRDCFKAVNHLIDCIEETFPGEKLQKIDPQTSASFDDNCNIIIDRANQIEELLEEKEVAVEERMDTLLKQIKDLQKKVEELIENSRSGRYSLVGISTVSAAYLLSKLVKDGYVSDNVFTQFGIIGKYFYFLVIFAFLSVGIDLFLSAIYGAFQSSQLDYALIEHTKAVEDLEFSARNWFRNIRKLKIKMHKKKKDSSLGRLSK